MRINASASVLGGHRDCSCECRALFKCSVCQTTFKIKDEIDHFSQNEIYTVLTKLGRRYVSGQLRIGYYAAA